MEVELEEVLLAEPEVMLVVEAIASTMEEEENEEDEEGRGEANGGGWSFWAKGLKRYEGGAWSKWPDLIVEAVPNRSSLLLGKGEDVKGWAGIPVNSWTMARKLVVSVVSTVVGARREALDRFLGLRATLVWSFEAEAVARAAFSGAGGNGIDGNELGKVARICPWAPEKGGVDDDEASIPPISVQLGSDLRVLDQTMSRFSREFGFCSWVGDRDKGSK